MTARPSISKNMATPPCLLLAALVFWGWLSGLLLFGVLMGVILESSRLIKVRFDLSAEDFRRLWNFCGLLGLALLLYTFTTNEEGGGVSNLFHGAAARNAVLSGVHAASVIPRWLPMLLFLLVAAQNFSERGCIPLAEVSIFFRWFQRGAAGAKTNWDMNVSYPYFMVCAFSAGIHANEGTLTYFWGQGILLAWGLWPFRARRFSLLAWSSVFLLAVILAYLSTRGIGQLAQLAESNSGQWMASLMRQRTEASQAMTSIGQIGQLKLSSAIVIRLETPAGASPPTYLHEATYWRYDQRQTWRAGSSQIDFLDIRPETNEGSAYDLLPDKTAKSTVNIACYLNGWDQEIHVPEGLLPLPAGCSQLENVPGSVVRIRTNKTGAVLAAGPGLIIFDARYGAATTIDSPPDTNRDWEVPPNELPALKQCMKEIHVSSTNEEQIELAVAHFFSSKFTYSTWLGPDKTAHTNETPLGRFLLQSRSGHCEYFATATVLLLRELGIPARYAVGYYVHEESRENHYVVRDRDAHAWCLVWDQKKQAWQDFDTTPGTWVATEGKRASAMQSVSDFFSWLQFQFSKLRWGQTHLRNYVLWAVVPAMSFLLYQIIFRRGRKRRARQAAGKKTAAILWPGLDSEFYQLESRLAARGVPRQPGESLADWLERLLTQKALADWRAPLQELLQLHYRHRFDPNGLGADERKLLAQKVRALLEKLADK